MALFENKVVTRYIADVSGEVRALEQLIRKNEQLKEAERQAAAERERHFDQLVLDVSRTARAEDDRGQVVFQTNEQAKRGTQELIGMYGKMVGAVGLAIGAIGAIEGVVRHWQDLEDEVTNLTNAVQKLADKTHSTNKIIADQVQVAHRLRVPLGQTLQLYDDIQGSLEGLGYSYQEQIKLSEQLGKAAIIEGRGLDQAGVFIKKLALTMSLGQNAGADLKKLMEELPAVAAQWVEKYGGSNRAFIEAVESGRVKFDDLVGTLVQGNGKVDESFAKRRRTNKEWRDEAVEAMKRAQGSGDNFVTSLKAGINQANGKLEDSRVTFNDWAEDLSAKLGRIEAKSYATFAKGMTQGINDATAAAGKLNSAISKIVEKLSDGTFGTALLRLADPWSTETIRGHIEMDDDDMSGSVRALRDKRAAAARAEAERRKALSSSVARSLTDDLVKQLEAESGSSIGAVDASAIQPMDINVSSSDLANALKYVQDEAKRLRDKSLFESAFGSIDEIDLYQQAFERLGATFGAFSEAVGAGYEAIVTGQSGIAEAFKKTLASGLLSIGKSSVVEALRQAALGFGALAFGSPTAAMHFKSAALHGAVALAAGVAANALGAGSGGSAPSGGGGGTLASGFTGGNRPSGSAGSGSGGGSGGGDDKRTMIIVYGDSFAQNSPRQRQVHAEKIVNAATGGTGVSHS